MRIDQPPPGPVNPAHTATARRESPAPVIQTSRRGIRASGSAKPHRTDSRQPHTTSGHPVATGPVLGLVEPVGTSPSASNQQKPRSGQQTDAGVTYDHPRSLGFRWSLCWLC